MRHHSSARQRDIEAEVAARRQAAWQAMEDKRHAEENAPQNQSTKGIAS